MTGVFCIVFGVVAEIVTKEMYGGEPSESKQQGEEKQHIVGKSVEEKRANNEAIWLKAEAEMEAEENEDDTPPPLPDKDYETGKLDTLSAKLQALVDASVTEDGDRTPENNDENNVAAGVPAVAREYDRTVSDEYNQNTSSLNCNLMHDISNSQSIIEEESNEQRNSADGEESSGQKFYAPDSSDEEGDDEDDDDYASREVNFDDSESEEEDFDQYLKNTSQESLPKNTDAKIDEEEDELAKKGENTDDLIKTAIKGQNGSLTGVKEAVKGRETADTKLQPVTQIEE